jgi:hypothetical protein
MIYRALIACVLASVVITACSDDDSASHTSAACDALVAIDVELTINEDLEAGIAAIEAFVAAAPEDVARAFEPVIPLLLDDPEAAFESDEIRAANVAGDGWALDNCADTTVDLEAVNYAFTGAPTDIEAGRVAFTITNHTQTDEVHEALLLRKDDDATGSAHQVLAAALDGQPASIETTLGAFEQFTFVGGSLVEPPGGSDHDVFVVDLEPGDYILACLLPVNSSELIEPYFAGEEVEGTYHLQSGMFAELTVR